MLLGHRFGVPVIYDMQSSLPEQLGQHLAFRGAPAQAALRGRERWLLRACRLGGEQRRARRRVRALAARARLREWHFASPLPQAARGGGARCARELGIEPRAGRWSSTAARSRPTRDCRSCCAAMPRVCRQVPEAPFVLVGAAEERRHDDRCAQHADLVGERRAARGRAPAPGGDAALPRPRRRRSSPLAPRGDNLPLKVFDYLAAGKPIVATDIPAHRSALDESRALLTGTCPAEIAAGSSACSRTRSWPPGSPPPRGPTPSGLAWSASCARWRRSTARSVAAAALSRAGSRCPVAAAMRRPPWTSCWSTATPASASWRPCRRCSRRPPGGW